MKLGILVNGKQEILGDDSSGFHQWANVFQGSVISSVEDWAALKDGDFDLILIRLTGANLVLIDQAREKFGPNSRTKIALSLDIPPPNWKREFEDPDLLKKRVRQADFVFATEYPMALALEEATGKTVYEIPHPVNREEMKKFQDIPKDNALTILDGKFLRRRFSLKKYIILLKFLGQSKIRIRVLSDGSKKMANAEYYRRKDIDVIICGTKEELYSKIAESRFILISETNDNENQHDKSLVIGAAMTGSIVIGGKYFDVMQRCYPEINGAPFITCLLWYWRLKDNPAKIEYLSEYAKTKAEYFYGEYPPKKLLVSLAQETKDPRFLELDLKLENSSIFTQIHYLYGAQTLHYQHEEFVIVCLVKNGAEYIKTFMNHYQRLGARHYFFIDNGSTDETVSLLKEYQDVTIYETRLPHKRYECEIRRAVIEKHCENNWCLCVDIDELFDYPYSERISMSHFLRYLNSHQYTAVLSYLLDMFSQELQFSRDFPEGDIVSQYCYYDLSHIQKSSYRNSFAAFTNFNQLADPKMMNYSGGIRGRFFKAKESGYLLTKHPLIFVNSKIEPVVHPHFCNKAMVADVNGVVKHYKFISSFKDKVIQSLVSQDYSYYAEHEYQTYYEGIKERLILSLHSRQAKKLEQVEQLIGCGFLRVSKKYRAYVESLVI
jgi:hypothetical protein